MSRLLELRQQRTKLITDAQAVALDPKPTAETRAKFATMMADVEALETDIANIERIEKLEAETRETQRPPRGNPGSGNNDKEERERLRNSAMSKYLRNVDPFEWSNEERQVLRETRDITTGGSATGGVLVGQLGPLVWDAAKAIGNLAGEVFKKSTPGNGAPLKISTLNDTANTLVTLTEDNAISASTDPTFGNVTLQSTDTIATMITVTWQELEDFDAQIVSNPAANLESFLRDKIGIRYLRGVENYVVNGNSSNISSIVTGATLGQTTAASGDFPVYADFVAMEEALDPAYYPNAKWAMSSKTRAYLMGLLDGFGRPFFLPNPSTGSLDQILGHPIVLSQSLPAANVAGNTGILLGDYTAGYVLRDSGPLYVKRLDERFADKLSTAFLAYARISGTSVNAGTNPVLKLATHA